MNSHPILFSTPMVQAILEGNKTMTRRMQGLKEINEDPDKVNFLRYEDNFSKAIFLHDDEDNPGYVKCPYGQIGDILWVRESFYIWGKGYDSDPKYLYKADQSELADHSRSFYHPKSSIHMPKEACRLFLKVTDIRVERLQDITEEDAKAEGAEFKIWEGIFSAKKTQSYLNGFKSLWLNINGAASWNANPWVWVISFERIEKPENF